MLISELVAKAKVKDHLNGIGPVSPKRTPDGYCYLAVTHLQEALQMHKAGRPAYMREGSKRRQGADFIEGLDDSATWGHQVAEAVSVLAALCRSYGIDLEQILARKYGGNRK
jgi:hypothetical protein